MRPEFIDNRELTMLEALRAHLDWLQETYAKPVELSIATGYFNLAGFALLADRLERLSRVRLLVGAEPIPPASVPLRMPGDPQPDRFQANLVRKALQDTESGFARDRDLLPFAPDSDHALRRLLAFLQTGRIEVRRYEKTFLHGKAYIFAADEGVIVGSSNFTAAGLTSNLELNLGRYDPTPVQKVQEWFNRLWDEALPFDLASVYAARFEPYEPYLVYLRVLWERYRDELKEEAKGAARIPLTTFQNDGIFRAERICSRHNGVLIADGVGLGKTFIGGALLREAVEDRRQRALLITSAALRDGTWERFKHAYGLYLEKISFEELVSDVQLGGDRPILKQGVNDYALVLVDEAQAFRNPDTKRAQALRLLLQGRPPKTLVLMSATPVNNSLWDLYYLLTYFIPHDAAFADLGIRSLKERFAEAVNEEPDDLKPDALFDILDATTVRRTRHFVRRYYPNDRIKGPQGIEIPVQFPQPHVRAVTYSFDRVIPGFFDEFAEALAPKDGVPRLTLARYTPSRYRPGGESAIREEALVGLLRSGLLKRFESSAYAFAQTVEKMARHHDTFLEALNRGVVLTAEGIDEWEQADLLENAGEDPSAHSGEEYRQELRKGLERYGRRIEQLPGGAGSGFRGGPAKGHFFCARVGDRVFLRFLPLDGSKAVKDTLGCLRLIACREETARDLAPDLQARAYEAWQSARRDIWEEWTFATDPANLQPRVRLILRTAAAHLRRYPPLGMTQEELDTLIEAVEAPWGARIERQIREAMAGDDPAAVSAALAAKVRDLGLQPFRAPNPLPPIQEDEIHLVCWMGVDTVPAS